MELCEDSSAAAAGAGRGSTSSFPTGKLDELTARRRKADVNDYDWRLFGPDLRRAEWSYHAFDPVPEEQASWDSLITRRPDVMLPKGMNNWFAVDFDATKAGWKRGQSPLHVIERAGK